MMQEDDTIAVPTPKFISLDFLREHLSRDQQTDIALALEMCLECGGGLRRLGDGEVVCERCGVVWCENEESLESRIPFPEFDDAAEKGHYEMHWQPECNLAFEKGLGTSLDDRMLTKILTHANNETLMITRLFATKSRANNHDPPQLRRLLTRISILLDRNGLRNNHVVADYAGRVMRKLYSMSKAIGVRLPISMADAVVAYTFHKFKIKNYNITSLNLRIKDLAFIKWYIQLTKELCREYKLPRKLIL
ncbi:MAG: hypothetical protein QXU81_00090 [Candidatus Bathyarchaeia archaeon]